MPEALTSAQKDDKRLEGIKGKKLADDYTRELLSKELMNGNDNGTMRDLTYLCTPLSY